MEAVQKGVMLKLLQVNKIIDINSIYLINDYIGWISCSSKRITFNNAAVVYKYCTCNSKTIHEREAQKKGEYHVT